MAQYSTRLTKGLLRHHYPCYDYSASRFRVQFLQPWDERLGTLEEVREMLAAIMSTCARGRAFLSKIRLLTIRKDVYFPELWHCKPMH
jgi:hypothetical protein